MQTSNNKLPLKYIYFCLTFMPCSYVLQVEFYYPIPTVTELDANDDK